jgi:hypothetical protein
VRSSQVVICLVKSASLAHGRMIMMTLVNKLDESRSSRKKGIDQCHSLERCVTHCTLSTGNHTISSARFTIETASTDSPTLREHEAALCMHAAGGHGIDMFRRGEVGLMELIDRAALY